MPPPFPKRSGSLMDAPEDPPSSGQRGAQPQRREALEAERQEDLSIEAEVRLAEGIVSPGLPKARPTLLIEKREPDLLRVERVERLDLEKPA
jgi:hypothetical protein